jgi:hypothetical protein
MRSSTASTGRTRGNEKALGSGGLTGPDRAPERSEATVLEPPFLGIEREPPPPMRRDLSKPRGPLRGVFRFSPSIIPDGLDNAIERIPADGPD